MGFNSVLKVLATTRCNPTLYPKGYTGAHVLAGSA
jgi:hypothetical protein